MKVKVNWQPKKNLVGTTNAGHRILLRAGKHVDIGGNRLGSIELMLLGLGSSKTVSVIHVLRKSKVDIQECLTQVSLIPNDSKLSELDTIHLHFDFFGDSLSEPKLNRALALAENECCPISNLLLRSGIAITHTFTIHAPEAAPQSKERDTTSILSTQGLHHVALTSTNFEASRKFYTEVMKMQVEWEPDNDNIYLTNGTDNLAIHRGTHSDSKLDHIGFILESKEHVDEWYSHLTNNDVPIDKEPKTHRDGARSFYVIDPDGVCVQLIYHPPLSDNKSY